MNKHDWNFLKSLNFSKIILKKAGKGREVKKMNIGRSDRNYSLMQQNLFQSKGNMQFPSFGVNYGRKDDETAMTFQQYALDAMKNTERKHKRKRLKQSPKVANRTGKTMPVNGTKQLQQGNTPSEFEPRPCDCNGWNIMIIVIYIL